MKAVLQKYKINEQFTKFIKNKHFTKIYDQIPHNKNLNFMMDILYLPETKEKYKYLLVCVDLFSRQFDIEPLKTKTAEETLKAFKTMITRKYIKMPYYSIQTDNGAEFQKEFESFLSKNNIYHKIAMPYRHSQMSMVENLNKQLGRIFNGYMNLKEQETGKTYKEWINILDDVRTEMNKIREFTPSDNQFTQIIKPLPYQQPKFKIGDIVYYKSEFPLNALGQKQNTMNFRVGDYRYNIKEPRKIINIFYYSDKPYHRYYLEGIKNATYTDNELILSNEKESKYIFERILNKKTVNKINYYLIKWKNYTIKNATWENEKQLIEDNLKDEINEYNAKL